MAEGSRNPQDILEALRKVSQQTQQPAQFQSRRYTPPSQGVRDRQLGVNDARIAALRSNPAMRPLIDELAAGGQKPSGALGSLGRLALDNPLAKIMLSPLAIVDTGRRTAISGVREIVDALDSDPNTKASFTDFSKQALDTTYGFGTAFPMAGAKGRVVGFLGDVLLDPLTYATLGSAIPAKALIAGSTKTLRAELGFKRIMGFDARAALARKAKEFGAADSAVKEIAARGRSGLFNSAPDVAAKMGINRPGIYYFGSRLRVPFTGPAAKALENGLATARLSILNNKRVSGLALSMTTSVGSRNFGDNSGLRFSLATGNVSDPKKAVAGLFYLSDVEEATGVLHMEYDTAVKMIREIQSDPSLQASKDTVYRFLDVPEDRWPDLIGRAPTPEEAAAMEKIRPVLADLRKRVDDVYKSADPNFPGIGKFSAYFPHVITEDAVNLMDDTVSPWAEQARQYFKIDPTEGTGSFSARNARAGMEWFGESPERPYILTEADVLGGVDRLNELSMQFVGIKVFETDAVEVMARYANHYADMMARAHVFKKALDRPWTGGRLRETIEFDEARYAQLINDMKAQERRVTLANEQTMDSIANATKAVANAAAALVRSGSSTAKPGKLRGLLSEMEKAIPVDEAMAQLAQAKSALASARSALTKEFNDFASKFDELGEQMEGVLAAAELAQRQLDDATNSIDGAISAYSTEWGDEVIRQDAIKRALDEAKENLAIVQRTIAEEEQAWSKRIQTRENLEQFLNDLTKNPEMMFFSDETGLGLPLPFRNIRYMRGAKDTATVTQRKGTDRPWSSKWTNSKDADVVRLRLRFDPDGEFSGTELGNMKYYDPDNPQNSVATIIANSAGAVEDLRNVRKAVVWLVGRTVLANDGKVPVSTFADMYDGMEVLMRQAAAVTAEMNRASTNVRRSGARNALEQIAEGKLAVDAVDGGYLRDGLNDVRASISDIETRMFNLADELEMAEAAPAMIQERVAQIEDLSARARTLDPEASLNINKRIRQLDDEIAAIEAQAKRFRPASVINKELEEAVKKQKELSKTITKLESKVANTIGGAPEGSKKALRTEAIMRVAGLYGGVGEFVQNLAEVARVFSIRSQTELIFQEFSEHMGYVFLVPTQDMYNKILVSVAQNHERAAAQYMEMVRQATDYFGELQSELGVLMARGETVGAVRAPMDSVTALKNEGKVEKVTRTRPVTDPKTGRQVRDANGNLVEETYEAYEPKVQALDIKRLEDDVRGATEQLNLSIKIEQTLRMLYAERSEAIDNLRRLAGGSADTSGPAFANALRKINEIDEQMVSLLGREGVELEAESAFGGVRSAVPEQQAAAARYEALRSTHQQAQDALTRAEAAATEIGQIDSYIAQVRQQVEADLRYDQGRRQFPESKSEVKKAAQGRQQVNSEIEQLTARRNKLEQDLLVARENELALRNQLLDTSRQWFAGNIFSDAQLYSSSSGKLYRLNVEAAIQSISAKNTGELKRAVSNAKTKLTRAQRFRRTREEVSAQSEIDPVTWLRGELNDLFENPARAEEARIIRAVEPSLYYKWAVDRFDTQRSRNRELFDIDGGLMLAYRVSNMLSELRPEYRSQVNILIGSNLGKINRGGKILRSSHDAVYEPDKPRFPTFLVKDEKGNVVSVQLGDLVNYIRTTDKNVSDDVMKDFLEELHKALKADLAEAAKQIRRAEAQATSDAVGKGVASAAAGSQKGAQSLVDQVMGSNIIGSQDELARLTTLANGFRAQALGPRAAKQQAEIDSIVAELDRLTRVAKKVGGQVETTVVDQLVAGPGRVDANLASRVTALVKRLRKYEEATTRERQALREAPEDAINELKALVENYDEAIAAYDVRKASFKDRLFEATGTREVKANLGFYRRMGRMQATTGVGAALDRALSGSGFRGVNDFFAQLIGGTTFDPRQGYRTAKIVGGRVDSVVPVKDQYVTTFMMPDGRLVDGKGNMVNGAGQRLKDNGEVMMEFVRGPRGKMENVPVMGARSPYPTRIINRRDSVMGNVQRVANERHARVFSLAQDGVSVIDQALTLPKAESGQVALSSLDSIVGKNGYLRQMRLTLEILDERISRARELAPKRAKAAQVLGGVDEQLAAVRSSDAAKPRGRPEQRIETLQGRIREIEQSQEYMIAAKRMALNEFLIQMGRYSNPAVYDRVVEIAQDVYGSQVAALRSRAEESLAKADELQRRGDVQGADLHRQSAEIARGELARVEGQMSMIASGFPRTMYRGAVSSPIFEALFRPKLTADELKLLDKEYKSLLAERRQISARLDRTGKKPLQRKTVERLEAQHNQLEERLNDIIRERTLFYTQHEQLQLQGIEIAERLFRMMDSPEFQQQIKLSGRTTAPGTGVTTKLIDEGEGKVSPKDLLYRIVGKTTSSAQYAVDDARLLKQTDYLNSTFLNNPDNKVIVKRNQLRNEMNMLRREEANRTRPIEQLERQRERILMEIAELDDDIRRLDVDGFIDDLNEVLESFYGEGAKPAVWQVRPGGKTLPEISAQAKKAVSTAEKQQAKEVAGQKYYEASETLLGNERAVVEARLSPAQARRRELLEQIFNLEQIDFASRQEMNDLLNTIKVLLNLNDNQVKALGIDISVRDAKTGRALTGSGSTVSPEVGLKRYVDAVKLLQAERNKILAPFRKAVKDAEKPIKGLKKKLSVAEKKKDAAARRLKDVKNPKVSSKARAVASAAARFDNSIAVRGADDAAYKEVRGFVDEVLEMLELSRSLKVGKGDRNAAWEAEALEFLSAASELFAGLRSTGYLPEGSVGKAAQAALDAAPAGQADFLASANTIDPATFKVVAQYLKKKKEYLDELAKLGDMQVEKQMMDTFRAMSGDPQAIQQYLAMFGELPGMTVVKTFRDGMVEVGKNFPNSAFTKEYSDIIKNMKRLQEPEIARQMGQFLGWYTRMFKAYATLSPGFHIRNAMHNAFMLFAAGVDLDNMRVGAGISKSWTAASGRGIAFEEWIKTVPENLQENVKKAMLASWSSGGGMTDDALRNPTPFPAFLTGGSKRLGRWIEQHSRFMMAFDAVNKGADVAGAAGVVRRHLFDYENISNADRVMRQFVPFWMWTSRNLPLQIQLMWTNPKPYQIWSSFKRNIEDKETDNAVPLWMREIGGFKLPVGDNLYATPDFGFNRVDESIGQLKDPAQLLSQVNPMLRVPMELASGTQFFGNRRFSDNPLEVSGGASAVLQPLLEALGYGETGAGGKKFVNERAFYALRNMLPPIGRLESMNPTTPLGRENASVNPLLGFLGSPVRKLTQQQQEAELARRQNELRKLATRERMVNAPQE